MKVISVEHISKAYRLGLIGGGTLHEDLGRLWATMRGRPDPLARVGEQRKSHTGGQFWALQDVSFTVNEGEVLGIIGRNGAGKSTLLKILSRVTAPTSGRILTKGRIASLLEVGTGFHAELTGRENIFLNGAILGMSHAEIRRKLDEIIAFSGIEEFIDTPVKRYSSGMNVRLAFAVAAHLEPEILVIDEVLAVGDAAFQKKCLGKMGEVVRGGRTILFVSHDLGTVSRLCQRGILLSDGRVETMGDITTVVARYTADDTRSVDGLADLTRRSDRTGTAEAQFLSAELVCNLTRTAVFAFGSPFTARLTIDVHQHFDTLQVATTIGTPDGVPIYEIYDRDGGCAWTGSAGRHQLTMSIPRLQLYPGDYVLDLWMGDAQSKRLDYVKDALRFRVVQTPGTGIERTLDRAWGLVSVDTEWTHDAVGS